MKNTRRFFAPEVIQTSAMDCGPASLKCLLEGFGTQVSYGRLREACQTEVDGTSIDTIEDVANRLGLQADQMMVPVDHLLLPETQVLPALVVVLQPGGMTHFVVVWRRHGTFIQVMDPATGRRWVRADRFLNDVYVHAMPLPTAAWRGWAESEGFTAPLAARLRSIGVQKGRIEQLFEAAHRDSDWRGFATLDAAARMVTALVEAAGVRPGRQAGQLLYTVFKKAAGENSGEAIPEHFWSVRPAPSEDGSETLVSMRGAVLLHVSGSRTCEETVPDLPPELAAALDEKRTNPAQKLWQLIMADGLLAPSVLLVALLAATAGVFFEALLFRGLFDLGHTLGLVKHRLAAMGLLLAFLTALLFIEWPIFTGILRMGRQLETRLRIAFLEKMPRLSDRYFQSRPVSDMAERSHGVHRLRQLPLLGNGLLRAGFGLLMTTAGLIWLDPAVAPLAVAAAGFAIAWPLLTKPVLAERDLRVQTHTGALGRFYLDTLLGLVAVRTHGAERAVRREHEALLVEWARAGLRLQRSLVGIEGVLQFLGFGLAAWLLFGHLGHGEPGTILLLVYWALNIPVLGQEFALQIRQYPTIRNATLRLLEPLGALEETLDEDRNPATDKHASISQRGGVILSLEGVSVLAGGHLILDNVDLHVPAGQHVAIVGKSGAGKSSLAGLLLGWHRASAGNIRVDDAPLDGAHLEVLRRETAWVDPAVQLWNTSLLDNLEYAAGNGEAVAEALVQADLRGVLNGLSEGLQTRLGEGGGRLSGGEGQRVRFGRAVMQSDARLVILDEPFRGLDRDKRRTLLDAARRHWLEATMLCITHDIAQTEAFDRVLVVEDGRIVEDGTPAGLSSRASRYRTLIEKEKQVHRELWEAADWRRLHLADGTLAEQQAPPRRNGQILELEHYLANEYLHPAHMADFATR